MTSEGSCEPAQSRQNLRCSHTWSIEVDEQSKKQTSSPTRWLRMSVLKTRLRRAKCAIISWDGSFHYIFWSYFLLFLWAPEEAIFDFDTPWSSFIFTCYVGLIYDVLASLEAFSFADQLIKVSLMVNVINQVFFMFARFYTRFVLLFRHITFVCFLIFYTATLCHGKVKI